jgi:putative transposase
MTRWLRRWGLARGKRRRVPGPRVLRAALRPAGHCNEVWTADFKGSYVIGDGTRVEPLTVRDLYSRYGLVVDLQGSLSVWETRKRFEKIFNKYGLPERIRCDNGVPFGGPGPTGLTRLSAWWVKLGIAVEFTAPGRPDQNGAHEQFQARRYRVSRRQLRRTEPWSYPAGWERRWVKGNGEISRNGGRRFVGEAFAGDYVGLQQRSAKVWRVYFGPLLIGELHENETGNIRIAQYRRTK